MSYPRNNASPERVSVGAVILIADGTVQTSGVSITMTPQGGVSAAGGGTTSYEQGVVFYIPTQAETNYTSFVVTAYKSGCIPVSATIVTTASVTPGRTRLESVTHTGATVPVVTDVTNLHASSATLANQTTLLGRLIGTIAAGTHNPQGGDSYARIGALGAGLTALAQSSALATAQTDLDTLTGVDGVTLATIQANYAPNKIAPDNAKIAGIQADLDNTTDGLGALKLLIDAVKAETALIVAATNELQGDWVNGGRLDLIIDAILDDTSTSGVALNATTANQVADAILNRDMSAVSDTNARSMLNALRFLRNKWSVAGTTLTVTKEDDSTSAWTATVSTDAAADPVTGSDPA